MIKSIVFILVFSFFSIGAQNLVPTLGDLKTKAPYINEINTFSFQPSDVKLLDGPFKRALQNDVSYLLEIDPDRLLHRFRKFSNLIPKGTIYGGWESESLSGHSLGHYLSACAIHFGSTGDSQFLDRLTYIINELDICQQARKTGYIGAIPKEDSVWSLVSKGDIHALSFSLNGAWSPWYTEHKILAGLLDAYWYAGNEKALDIAIRFCDWVELTLKNLNESQIQKMLSCEFGGMNESLINLYALTGNRKYLELSYKFEHNDIIDPLANKKDILNDKHSNTQIPKIIGSARRFEFTGSLKDKTVSEFFWSSIVNNHSYVIGGNSDSEHLGAPGKLNDRLSDNTAETCNTYNMLKLTRHLFIQNPNSKYADYYERALYNHIYASQRPTDGMMCYFTPLRKGGQRDYSDKFESFWCCVGSGMENHVKYNESIYYSASDGGLYVNLFIPSALNWREKNLQISQKTNYPEESSTTFYFNCKTAVTTILYIRKPWWAKHDFNFLLNGKKIKAKLDSNGYYAINRTWSNNDQLFIKMSLAVYTEFMPDNINRLAFLYGPLVLASPMGNDEPKPFYGTPSIITSNKNIAEYVNQESALHFKTKSIGSTDFKLIPLNTIQDERYNVYWDAYTPDQWELAKVEFENEKNKATALEKATIDYLQPGDSISEIQHKLASEKSFSGISNQRNWRDARENGFISFDMKNSKPSTLLLTFWGSDGGGSLLFDILIDGELIATQEIRQNFPNRFFDIRYPITKKNDLDKGTIHILLKPHTDKRVARLFGARLIQP